MSVEPQEKMFHLKYKLKDKFKKNILKINNKKEKVKKSKKIKFHILKTNIVQSKPLHLKYHKLKFLLNYLDKKL